MPNARTHDSGHRWGSHAVPLDTSYKEPYTVEDPNGNPIPIDSSESEHARDADRSASSQPQQEEYRQRERNRRPATPHPFAPGQAQERLDPLHDHYRPGSARHSVLPDELDPNSGYHRRTSHRQRTTDDRYDEGFDDRYAADASSFAQDTFATSRRGQQEYGYPGSRLYFPRMTETARTHESHSSHDASGGRSPELTRTQSWANQGDGLHGECEGITRSRRMYVFYG